MISPRSALPFALMMPLVSTMSGCGGTKYSFSSVSPAASTTHYASSDSPFNFAVTTAPENKNVRWCVYKYAANASVAESSCTQPSLTPQFTYTTQANDEQYQLIEVVADLQEYETIRAIEPPITYYAWQTKASERWEIRVGNAQMPPVWSGTFLFKNANDTAALAGFTTIAGHLSIENSGLTTPPALNDLTLITGNLTVSGNATLTAFSAPQLDVQGLVSISKNPTLTRVEGLAALTSPTGITIENNAQLTHVTGLSSLHAMNGHLNIIDNPKLHDISGFSSLQTLTGYLKLENAGALDLSGFADLTTISNRLELTECRMRDLQGLDKLQSVGALVITNNPNLTTTAGIEALTDVGDIDIYGNPMLASLEGFANLTRAREMEIGNTGMTTVGLSNFDYANGNGRLTSLAGLGKLTEVELIKVSGNSSLTTLAGLDSLATLKQLEIEFNNALADLQGLSTLQSVESLSVVKSKLLTDLTGIEHLQITKGIGLRENDAMTNLAGFPASVLELDALFIGENKALSNIDNLFHLQRIRDSLTIYANRKLCRQRVDALVEHLTMTGGAIPNVDTYSNPYCYSQN